MTQKALDVWQQYTHSLAENGVDWQELLANHVRFTGPLMQLQGKDAFIKMTADFMQLVSDFTLHRCVADEDLVCAEESFTVKTPSGNSLSMDVVEICEISNGKIQSVKLYYDPEAFRQAFNVPQAAQALSV